MFTCPILGQSCSSAPHQQKSLPQEQDVQTWGHDWPMCENEDELRLTQKSNEKLPHRANVSKISPTLVHPVCYCLREGLKKTTEKAVRLTAWVDPPPPPPSSGQENVKNFEFDF